MLGILRADRDNGRHVTRAPSMKYGGYSRFAQRARAGLQTREHTCTVHLCLELGVLTDSARLGHHHPCVWVGGWVSYV